MKPCSLANINTNAFVKKIKKYHKKADDISDPLQKLSSTNAPASEAILKSTIIAKLDLACEKGSLDAMLTLASLCKVAKEFERAIEYYNKAVVVGSRIAEDKCKKLCNTKDNISTPTVKHRRFDARSITLADTAVCDDKALLALAKTYYDKGKFDEIWRLKKSVSIGRKGLLQLKSCCSEGSGFPKSALTVIRKLKKMSNRGNGDASFLLGSILKTGDVSEALSFLDKAIKQGRKDAELEFLYVAITYTMFSKLLFFHKKICIDILLNAKKVHLPSTRNIWVNFFKKYLPKAAIQELKIDKDGGRIIGHLPKKVKVLDLSNNNLSAVDMKQFALCTLPALQSLNLSENEIGSAGAKALAQTLPPTLLSLKLCASYIGDDGIKALIPALSDKLQLLSLRHNGIGRGIEIFSESTLFRLRILDLSYNNLGDFGLKALAPYLSPELQELYLNDNGIGVYGVEALKLPATLQVLELRYNTLGDSGMQALAPKLPAALQHLDLSYNDIGNEGVKVFASYMPANIQRLAFNSTYHSCNKIDDEGIKMVAQKLPLTLQSLSLRCNSIGFEGIKALASKLPIFLRSLDIGNNVIGDAGLKVLAENLPLTLQKLVVCSNKIGDAGVTVLAWKISTLLTELDLHANNIGSDGMAVLVRHLPAKLRRLELGYNELGDEGVKMLSRKLPSTVTKLSLRSNNVSANVKRAFSTKYNFVNI